MTFRFRLVAVAAAGLVAAVMIVGCTASRDATTTHAAQATSPKAHLGPVTSIRCAGDVVYSCSQAGVFRGVGAALHGLFVPPFRALAIAPFRAADGAPLLLVGGGMPGRSGEVAVFDLQGGIRAQARIANDLVYDVDAFGSLGACACADGRVLLFELPLLQQVRIAHAHTGVARSVRLGLGCCVSGGRDTKVLCTNLAAPPVDLLIKVPGTLINRSLASATQQTLQLVDHSAGVECVMLDLASDEVGPTIVSGALDGKVRVHEQGRLVRTVSRLGGAVQALARDDRPGSSSVYVGMSDGRVLALAILPPRIAGAPSTKPSSETVETPTEATPRAAPGMAQGMEPGTGTVHGTPSGTTPGALTAHHDSAVHALAFMPQGLLAVGLEGRIEVHPADDRSHAPR